MTTVSVWAVWNAEPCVGITGSMHNTEKRL